MASLEKDRMSEGSQANEALVVRGAPCWGREGVALEFAPTSSTMALNWSVRDEDWWPTSFGNQTGAGPGSRGELRDGPALHVEVIARGLADPAAQETSPVLTDVSADTPEAAPISAPVPCPHPSSLIASLKRD